MIRAPDRREEEANNTKRCKHNLTWLQAGCENIRLYKPFRPFAIWTNSNNSPASFVHLCKSPESATSSPTDWDNWCTGSSAIDPVRRSVVIVNWMISDPFFGLGYKSQQQKRHSPPPVDNRQSCRADPFCGHPRRRDSFSRRRCSCKGDTARNS